MDASGFSTEATFAATVQISDPEGYGTLRFGLYMEQSPPAEHASALSVEDVAGALRDLFVSRGWTVDQFLGRPHDAPLDWPESA